MNKCHFVGAFVVFLWFFYPDRKNGYFEKNTRKDGRLFMLP